MAFIGAFRLVLARYDGLRSHNAGGRPPPGRPTNCAKRNSVPQLQVGINKLQAAPRIHFPLPEAMNVS